MDMTVDDIVFAQDLSQMRCSTGKAHLQGVSSISAIAPEVPGRHKLPSEGCHLVKPCVSAAHFRRTCTPVLKTEFTDEEACIIRYFEATYVLTNRLAPPILLQRSFLQHFGEFTVGYNRLGLPSTTNACERFHHKATHPSLPVFLANVHRQLALADMHVASVRSGSCRVTSPTLRNKMEKLVPF